MEMIEVKTADLIGPALDWATAKASGTKIDDSRGKELRIDIAPGFQSPWVPSVNWYQGGPLIEKYKVRFDYRIADFGLVMASACGLLYDHAYKGCDSYLVAACRAIVHANLGYTVSVPKDLMQ